MINLSLLNFDEVERVNCLVLDLDKLKQLGKVDHNHYVFLNQDINIEDDEDEHVELMMDIESINKLLVNKIQIL